MAERAGGHKNFLETIKLAIKEKDDLRQKLPNRIGASIVSRNRLVVSRSNLGHFLKLFMDSKFNIFCDEISVIDFGVGFNMDKTSATKLFISNEFKIIGKAIMDHFSQNLPKKVLLQNLHPY